MPDISDFVKSTPKPQPKTRTEAPAKPQPSTASRHHLRPGRSDENRTYFGNRPLPIRMALRGASFVIYLGELPRRAAREVKGRKTLCS